MNKKIVISGVVFTIANTLLVQILSIIDQALIVQVLSAILISALFYYAIYRLYILPMDEKCHWYRGMLDSIPQPISVTDMDMNWTFVNKSATDPLGVKMEDVLGQQCSNWGAPICKTAKCGVECLRCDKPNTFFDQWGKNFQVDTSYLYNRDGQKVGHIEVVNEITEKVALAKILEKVNEFSTQIDTSSNEVSSASNSLSNGATAQAAAIEEISSSMNQINTQSTTNAENAGQARQLSTEANTSTQGGLKKMDDTITAMREISESSDEIKKIIKNIDDIAFQTNLLALNAAVEAARAGAHGKGFAVVAEEVRSLAGRSAKAAKETADLIEDAVTKISKGNQFADETSEALSDISQAVTKVNDLVSDIADSSANQAQSVGQVNSGLSQIGDITQQNTAVAEESSAAAAELSNQAAQLKAVLQQFENSDSNNDPSSTNLLQA